MLIVLETQKSEIRTPIESRLGEGSFSFAERMPSHGISRAGKKLALRNSFIKNVIPFTRVESS